MLLDEMDSLTDGFVPPATSTEERVHELIMRVRKRFPELHKRYSRKLKEQMMDAFNHGRTPAENSPDHEPTLFTLGDLRRAWDASLAGGTVGEKKLPISRSFESYSFRALEEELIRAKSQHPKKGPRSQNAKRKV